MTTHLGTKTLIALAVAAALHVPSATAVQTYYAGFDGTPIFELNLYSVGEEPYLGRISEILTAADRTDLMEVFAASTRPLNAMDVTASLQAAMLWAEILGPGFKGSSPVTFTIVTNEEYNAAATSLPNLSADGSSFSYLYATMGKIQQDIPMQSPAFVIIGDMQAQIAPHLYTLPLTSGADLTSVLFHEFGHALGILNGNASDFGVRSAFTDHIYDRFGTQYLPDVNIVLVGNDDEILIPEPGSFYVGQLSQSGVWFKGEHVSEVLQGALPGIPINGWEGTEEEREAELGHSELERSLMSHQNYRNYTFFMEAELAMMQDLGYEIDRRNFYGYSIYGDHQTIVNDHPYAARLNGSYDLSAPNQATLGTGLHIYGRHNQVTQAALLWTEGTAGVGVRVDGTDNQLIVPQGVRIAADGAYGTGILFAYGNSHRLDLSGTVTALGEDGIALRFDFGHNTSSDDPEDYGEYRGSYIWGNPYELTLYEDGEAVELDPTTGYELNLDGPLMQEVNISGTAAGRAASIYISENALVQQIKVLEGARLYGDIISKWDPDNSLIDSYVSSHPEEFDLYTHLDFYPGTEPMLMAGSISGDKSIKLTVHEGWLYVTGAVDAYSLTNSGALTVRGENADGFAVDLTDTLTLEHTSSLVLPFDTAGYAGRIRAAGGGTLGGGVYVLPEADFYRKGEAIPLSLDFTGDFTGEFTELGVITYSPTLDFTLASNGESQALKLTAEAQRAAAAYSQYAADGGGRSLGSALYQLSSLAEEGWAAALLTALDFSAPDGAEVRDALRSLNAGAYDAAALVSLHLQQLMEAQALNSLLLRPDFSPDGTALYLDLLYSKFDGSKSGSRFDSDGLGLTLGFDHKLSSALTFGLNLTFTDIDADLKQPQAGSYDAKGVQAGARLFYRPAPEGIYALGSLRLGTEEGDLTRHVRAGGFTARTTSSWHALTGGAQLAAGYNFSFDLGQSTLEAGPFAMAQYSFIRRPQVSESGSSAALKAKSEYYDSLPLSAGFNLNLSTPLEEGGRLSFTLQSAFYHELLDDEDETSAHFKDYASADSFHSRSERAGSYGLRLNGALSAAFASGLTLRLSLGGDVFDDDADSLFGLGEISYRF